MTRGLFLIPFCLSLLTAAEFPVGSKATDIVVTDLSGAKQTVHLASGVPTAVIFTSTQCPISNAYNERMNQLYKEFHGADFRFVFVNANQNETANEIRQHLDGNKLEYAVAQDPGNRLADQLNASVTPEAFVFDRDGVLRYHGAVDDSQNEARVKRTPLRDAIVALKAGTTPERAEYKAFGCTIKRGRRTT